MDVDDTIAEFVAEAREGLEALDGKLVHFEQSPNDAVLLDEIFRLAHSIKGASGFLGLSRLQTVTHAAENVLGAFRDETLAVDSEAVTAVLDVMDAVRAILDALERSGAEPPGDDAALIARLDAIFAGPVLSPPLAPAVQSASLLERLGGEATLDAACEFAIGKLVASPETGRLFAGIDIDRLQGGLRDALAAVARGKADDDAFDVALLAAPFASPLATTMRETFADTVRAALIELEADPDAVAAVLPKSSSSSQAAQTDSADAPHVLSHPTAQAVAPASPSGPVAETHGPQTIRVAVDTLENMMTTVSELVLIRNQLLQTLRSQPDTPFAGPLHRLNQVTSELQEGVMTARMQPIGGAWSKLPRLVRDLAADLGKRISLTLSGEETELDRQVLELIKDPLVHMIRNAADHGLETPEERSAVGKPPIGRINLSARHESGAIVVEISDDGRGLPAARIRAKAVASGLLTAAKADAISDAEARRMIFAPGFSTAETVTAVSGRGVGMDVVRTNIEKIGGVIEVDSLGGQGSRFTIRIPLTLSIVSALIVECCGDRFALPQSGIVELVSAHGPGARRIEEINGASVLRLRDRLLPVISLQAMLGLDVDDEVRTETCIVVAQAAGFVFGVIVDRVFDTEEIVVKPVASVLRHLKLYCGTTILGDGSVIMILDVKGVSVEAGASGLISTDPIAEDEPAVEAILTEPMLLFKAADGVTRAARLGDVARIEELASERLEVVDGRSVMQYRGRLAPVLGLNGQAVEIDADRRRPLLVFSRDERNLGLLVDEIVDVMDGSIKSELSPSGPNCSANAIIGGKAVEVIDIAFYWRRANNEAEPDKTAASTPANLPLGPLKRLLIVDQSPFTQLLLRPLLAQAGYAVEVASDPGAALRLHDGGATFDLILADTSRSAQAAQLAGAFRNATAWHRTPLLGLGAHRLDPHTGIAEFADGMNEADIVAAVDDCFREAEAA